MDLHRVVLTLALSAAILLVLLAIVLVYRFVTFCLADLNGAPVVTGLPRDTWRLLIVFLIPIGGMLYLRFGRPH
jgi:hypothetical protein